MASGDIVYIAKESTSQEILANTEGIKATGFSMPSTFGQYYFNYSTTGSASKPLVITGKGICQLYCPATTASGLNVDNTYVSVNNGTWFNIGYLSNESGARTFYFTESIRFYAPNGSTPYRTVLVQFC